jgi:GH43 family beta-xylosidase
MRKSLSAFRLNAKLAQATWGGLSESAVHNLRSLTVKYGLSVAAGDLQFLEGRWYVTHAGLLRISDRRRCFGIKTVVEKELSEPAAGHWVFKATVYKSRGSTGCFATSIAMRVPRR